MRRSDGNRLLDISRERVLGIAALTLVWIVTAEAGLMLAVTPDNVTAVWAPSGLAVAALLRWGRHLWPAIVLGTIVVASRTGAPPACWFGFAAGNAIEALFAVELLQRGRFNATRMNTSDVGRLVLAAAASALVAAGFGSAMLVVTGQRSIVDFEMILVTWWIGNVLGILLVAPFILVWAGTTSEERRHRVPELVLMLGMAVAVASLVFEHLPTSLYLTFPSILWAATRLGLRGVVSVVIALWVIGAVQSGPMVLEGDRLPALTALGTSQLYVAVCGIVGLILGGAINERDRTRRELNARDEWSRAIFDRVVDIVAVLDEQGVTHWITPSVNQVLGRQPEEVIGQPLAELVHPDEVDRVAGQLARLATQPHASARVRARVRHGDGHWRTIEANVTNALDNPSVRGLVLCSRDVTTEVNAARVLEGARAAALESARMRSEFLANVSHELRTPLNVVFGITDMLLDEPLLPRHEEQLRKIRQSAASLLHLIDDILDVAKIDAGRLELRRAAFRVSSVVDDAVAVVRPGAEAKGLLIAVTIAPELDRELVGDPDRIRQILLNYLGNAVKFTDQGSVRVTVTPFGESADAVRVRFEVQDTGIGIPEGRRHRLFQPFSQIDGSMSRRFGGTGLGLAISKQLAELMGGGVGVSSMPGLGSIFWFEVRLEKSPAYHVSAAGARTTLHTGDGSTTVEP